jgi:hypothetical protein
VLSSGSDIQILRRNGPGKTTLVSGDFRLATLIGEEFHLLFFPDRIQRLWVSSRASSAIFSATLSLSITVFASLTANRTALHNGFHAAANER